VRIRRNTQTLYHPKSTCAIGSVLGSTRLTYAQVDAAANRVANLLVERGIRPGDKVALSRPNLPCFPMQALTDDVDVDRIAKNLRVGVSGGAALPVELANQVHDRLFPSCCQQRIQPRRSPPLRQQLR
jgi:acyl-CoA synthetase (AMP-forming)/AMP-acid ligase II